MMRELSTHDIEYSVLPAVRSVKRRSGQLWRERMMEHSKQWRRVLDLSITRIEVRNGETWVYRQINGREFGRRWLSASGFALLRSLQEIDAASGQRMQTTTGYKNVFNVNRDRVQGALVHYEHSWDEFDRLPVGAD